MQGELPPSPALRVQLRSAGRPVCSCYVRMRCSRLSTGTIQLQPLHDHVIRCITDCCDMPGIAVGQQVMGARLGTSAQKCDSMPRSALAVEHVVGLHEHDH